MDAIDEVGVLVAVLTTSELASDFVRVDAGDWFGELLGRPSIQFDSIRLNIVKQM